MFDFGFTMTDARRVAWTLVQAALAVVIAYGAGWVEEGTLDFKAAGIAVVAALIATVKNFVLADGSAIK